MPYDKDKYIRLTIAVPNELNDKIVKLADAMHISKTALVIQMIESNIDTLSKTWELMKNPTLMNSLIQMSQSMGDFQNAEFLNKISSEFSSNSQAVQDGSKLIDEITK